MKKTSSANIPINLFGKMIKNIIYSWIIIIAYSFTCAQPAFVSNELKLLYTDLSQFNKNQIEIIDGNNHNSNLTYYSTFINIHGQQVNVIIEKSYDSLITHLGINLFKKYPGNYSKYVYQFSERFLLKTLLQKENIPFAETDELSLLLNDKLYSPAESNKKSLLSLINNFTSLKLSKQSDAFILNITDDSLNNLELIFGIKYDLITGMDKKELDEMVYAGLSGSSISGGKPDSISIPPADQLKNLGKNIYVDKNNQLIDGISNSRYFIVRDAEPEIIFEKKYPEQSVKNIFYEPILAKNTTNITVKQKLYGGRIVQYQTSLSDFSNYFMKNCELYTGVESIIGDSIRAMLVYYETDLKLLHLAVVDLNYADLFKQKSTSIACQLFANIRTDNISNIFKEYTNRKEKIKIKLY